MNGMISFIPEIFTLFASMSILMLGLIKKAATKIHLFSITFSIILFALTIIIHNTEVIYIFDKTLKFDTSTAFFKQICISLFIIIILVSNQFLIDKKIQRAEFYSLLFLSLLGTLLLISSENLIMIFLGIELTALCLYSMIALSKNNILSYEAAIKYFVLSIIASGLLLFGFSFLYGISSSLNLSDILNDQLYFENLSIYFFSYILIFVGIAFKFAAAPFHMWLPDIYEGSPYIVTTFISSIPKIGIFYIAFRFLDNNLIMLNDLFLYFLMSIGLLSIALGNIFALSQTKVMRLLAYSGIANAGFIFLGIFVSSNSSFYVPAFYIIIYSISSVGIISILSVLSSKGFNIVYINDLKGFVNNSAFLSLSFLIILLSLAGIPFTAGFYAKYIIFNELISREFFVIALIAIIFTAIGLYYYLRIIWFIYFEDGFSTLYNVKNPISNFIIFLIPIIIIILFLVPDLLLDRLISIL